MTEHDDKVSDAESTTDDATHTDATASGASRRFRSIRIGALIALLGGVLVTAANISEIAGWFVPDETREVLEQTRSTIATTDAKVDELMQLLRQQAAASGVNIDAASQRTIQDAIRTIVVSGDARKDAALALLTDGNADAAAAEIANVAQEQSRAITETMAAAAASWRQAGAIYYTSNIAEAVRSYEAAYELEQREPLNAKELGFTYIRAGRLDDARRVFEAALTLDPDPALQSDIERGLGAVLQLRGNYEPAKVHLRRAMELAEQGNDRRRRTLALLRLAAIARAQGDTEHAREQFEMSVRWARDTDDHALLGDALNALGISMSQSEQYEAADAVLNESLTIRKTLNDLAGQTLAIGNLGANALKRGDIDAADRYLTESVALGERLGWQQSIAFDLVNLGAIAQSRGRHGDALDYLERAHDIARDIELHELTPIIVVNMGEVERDRGNHSLACGHWADALPELDAMQHAAADVVRGYRSDLNCPATPAAADP